MYKGQLQQLPSQRWHKRIIPAAEIGALPLGTEENSASPPEGPDLYRWPAKH